MNTSQDQKILNAMRSFLPRKVASPDRKNTHEMIDGIIFCADISGFTKMSESLAAAGREGSEEVTRIINLFFGPLVEIILKNGGDIFFFGGDAISALFDKDNARGSLKAADECSEFVKKAGNVKTLRGNFSISIHIAVNSGRSFFLNTGKGFVLAGRSCFRVIGMLDMASRGETVISGSVKKLVPGVKCSKTGEDLYRFKSITDDDYNSMRPESLLPVESAEEERARLTGYFPKWLKRQIETRITFDQSDGEHRKAAVIFMHFSSIPFDEKPEKASEISKTILDALFKGAEKFGGWINKLDFYKDGLRALVVFGFPSKLDNDDRHAVLFSKEIADDLKLKDITIRTGINSGSVFITPIGTSGRMEITVMGDAVNTAARIAASSVPGKITVGERVYKKTGGTFSFGASDDKEMKGKAGKVRTYEFIDGTSKQGGTLLKEWISESRKLIGNKDLLLNFRKAIEKVMEGRTAAFTLEGEAGIGKSRILRELEKKLEKENFLIRKGNCLSYGKPLSYHPWIEILKSIFGLTDSDQEEEKRKKISSYINSLDPALKNWLTVIGEVMGIEFSGSEAVRKLDNSIKMQKFFDMVLQIMIFESCRQPLCIILEDFHWADTSSSDLLSYILRNMNDRPALFLLASRPSAAVTAFKSSNLLFENRVRELSGSETGELISDLLQVKELPEGFKKLIIEKSQGNPFYVEELVKSLIEQSLIIKTPGAGWSFSGDPASVALPDSVEGVILSRIDRLDIKDREVLQTASVLGREFKKDILFGLFKERGTLERTIDSLRSLDLILTDDSDTGKFIFKHILTCETAYNTLSFAKRRKTHGKVGAMLEKKAGKKKEQYLSMLSYHYHNAKNYGKSSGYSIAAGKNAMKVFANDEGIEYFTRAVEAFDAENSLIRSAVEALLARTQIYVFLGKNELGFADADRSVELARKTKDDKLIAKCYADYCVTNELTHRYDKIKNTAEKALSLYKKLSDSYGMARSYNYIGMYYGFKEEPEKELEYLNKAVALAKNIVTEERAAINKNRLRKLKKYPSSPGSELLGIIFNNIGYIYRLLGDNEKAIIHYKESLKIRKDINDRMGVGQSLNNIGMFYSRQGFLEKGMKYFLRSVKIYEEISNRKGLSASYQNIGASYSMIGEKNKDPENFREALDYFSKALDIRTMLNEKPEMSGLLLWTGKTYLNLQMPEKALEYFNRCLMINRELNNKRSEAVALFHTARAYGAMKEPHKQLDMLISSLNIYEDLNAVKEQTDILNSAIQTAEILNDFETCNMLKAKLEKLRSSVQQ
ncbi:MAG: tetratricopeptide repeat protein [Candidatus Delongbacteria bacterium]